MESLITQMLEYSNEERSNTDVKNIINYLMYSHYDHEYAISAEEMRNIGLNVMAAQTQMEIILWNLYIKSAEYIALNQFNENRVLELFVGQEYFSERVQAVLSVTPTVVKVNEQPDVEQRIVDTWRVIN
jgi:hypothetical protein